MLLSGAPTVDREEEEAIWSDKRGRVGDICREAKLMHIEREARLAMLRTQIAQGDYRVDPRAVADAILRRMRLDTIDDARSDQKECSYPVSLPSTPPKAKPGGPSMTQPIQANPVLATATSASLRAVGGMHRHSS
jgi:anti-sigma-28 factor FlgM